MNSASVVSIAVWEFDRRLRESTHVDAGKRAADWRSVCDRNAGRWVHVALMVQKLRVPDPFGPVRSRGRHAHARSTFGY